MLSIAGVLLVATCGPAPPGEDRSGLETSSAPAPEGHRRMLALLERVRADTPNDNPYIGDRLARELRARYENLPEDASDLDRWRLLVAAGKANLKLGHTEEAIDLLSRARERIPGAESELSPVEVVSSIFRLGMAYMRHGETQNCCLRYTPDSCLLPIRGSGVHTKPFGSRQAIPHFTEVLLKAPPRSRLHFTARWLLNIAYMTLGDYPDGVPAEYLIPPEAFEADEEIPRFRNIAPSLGLNVFDLSGGAIVDDADNDGDLDIVTSTWDPAGPMHFFRNNNDGTFSDRTAEAGLTGLYGGLNLKQADYDNDGDFDILVLRGAWLQDAGRHPNSLLSNNGDGSFVDVTLEAGLGAVHYPTQTAGWADYDNDGDLDLYIGNESTPALRAPCQLFKNNGDGTFTDVAKDAGVENFRWAKGVSWGDYDGDRFPDLYVSNLAGDNRLYRNGGDGRFVDVAPGLDLTRPKHSFPVWFWDFDNDGILDLYVAGYTPQVGSLAATYLGHAVPTEPSCLYRGTGQGRFQEVARAQNVARPIPVMGSNFGDLDNDGYLDFYLGTGYPAYEALMPNLMYRNRGGTGFSDVTTAGGFGHLQKGHSIAFADLDHDGDQDVFQQMGGAFPGDKFGNALYENPGFGNHWITIKLVGKHSNRSAIGTRIRAVVVENGKTRSIYKHVGSGGSFGAGPLRQTIGLGTAPWVEVLEIFWPTTGLTQVFQKVAADQTIEIVEERDDYVALPYQKLVFGS